VHHATVDRWSRAGGWLHRRDPRVKIAVLLILLVAIGSQNSAFQIAGPIYLSLLLIAAATSRLPLGAIMARSALVLPFSLTFAVVTALAGDAQRAGLLVAKSYLSALAALLLIATTTLPAILHALAAYRLPPYLITVTQFLYRYLFVVSEEAQHMRIALASRGSGTLTAAKKLGFQSASGIVASLFARSYQRAQDIHNCMLARGFDGSLPSLHEMRLRGADWGFALLSLGCFLMARLAGPAMERLR